MTVHHFHGSKINTGYQTRYKQLIRYSSNPETMLSMDHQGLLIPNEKFPDGLKNYIKNYLVLKRKF